MLTCRFLASIMFTTFTVSVQHVGMLTFVNQSTAEADGNVGSSAGV